ncbi:MAG TPA: hypothetical protein VK509_20815, partial [Polyangiales bacterium]|nr:hypothetical protein [Polyangiales bacterium]
PQTPGQPNNPGTAGNPAVPTAGAGAVAGSNSTPPMTAGGSGAPTDPGPEPGEMTGEACRGFSYDGIKYSPGGTALPNKCMPFNATTNNPFAVRCVDVWPWYTTKYPGDNYCILPPPPEKGIQYGVHPQGKKWFEQVSAGDMSGYDNPSTAFVMEDGEEEEGNYLTGTPNTAEIKFYRNSARMRGGSHHMIVSWETSGGMQEAWSAGSAGGLGGNGLPGAQRPDENAPKSLDKPAEDKGLYSVLGANAVVTFNMHHFNPTGKQILKEAWTNLWFEEDATIRTYGILGLPLGSLALSVVAGSTADLHFSTSVGAPVRIVTLFGHRHAWTTNFSSWIERPGGNTEIVYQSFDWYDEPTYRYDSMTMNPMPASDMKKDGAHSGILTLQPGEKLHFNCHIEFTDERAVKVNSPVMPAEVGVLTFANQAFNAEMCILFGSTAATSLGTPSTDTTPLPPFATID